MHGWLQASARFLELHQGWTGPLLGVAACLEAVVVVGVFVPVTPLLVLLGAALAAGAIGPGFVLWCACGAVVGSAFSYQLGRWTRVHGLPPAWQRFVRATGPAAEVFARYGSAAIIIGRLIGGASAIFPFVAGWTGMPHRRFLMASAVASLIWSVTMTAIGCLGAETWIHVGRLRADAGSSWVALSSPSPSLRAS